MSNKPLLVLLGAIALPAQSLRGEQSQAHGNEAGKPQTEAAEIRQLRTSFEMLAQVLFDLFELNPKIDLQQKRVLALEADIRQHNDQLILLSGDRAKAEAQLSARQAHHATVAQENPSFPNDQQSVKDLAASEADLKRLDALADGTHRTIAAEETKKLDDLQAQFAATKSRFSAVIGQR